MNNLREVNDDILKDWLEFREETLFCTLSAEDKKHFVYFDEISERILKNVPEQNKKYVKKQLVYKKGADNGYICTSTERFEWY